MKTSPFFPEAGEKQCKCSTSSIKPFFSILMYLLLLENRLGSEVLGRQTAVSYMDFVWESGCAQLTPCWDPACRGKGSGKSLGRGGRRARVPRWRRLPPCRGGHGSYARTSRSPAALSPGCSEAQTSSACLGWRAAGRGREEERREG